MLTNNMYEELKNIFISANYKLLTNDKTLFTSNVSERTLCGALMRWVQQSLINTPYSCYYADVEYNRNKGGKLKTVVKTNNGRDYKIIKITCDLIVHSRGEVPSQDNLIAIEMKKSYRSNAEKEKDRDRLKCLTKDSFDDVWSFDGKTLPEHVCRYVIGIYYEIDYAMKEILLEYYHKGHKVSYEIISI